MSDLNRRLSCIETRLAEPTPAAFDLDELYTPEHLAEIEVTLDPWSHEAARAQGPTTTTELVSSLWSRILHSEPQTPPWSEASERLWRLTQGDLSQLDRPHWDPADLINRARVAWLGLAKYYRWLDEDDGTAHPTP